MLWPQVGTPARRSSGSCRWGLGTPIWVFGGRSYFGGDLPLYFSLYPGAIALVLVCFSGRPGFGAGLPRLRFAAWLLVVAGLFVAVRRHEPTDSVGYPSSWQWDSCGFRSRLGCGWLLERVAWWAAVPKRAFVDRDLRGLARSCGVVVLLFIGLCAAVLQFDGGFNGWLGGLGVEARVGEIRPRWIGLSFFGAVLACTPWLAARWLKGLGAAAALAFVHALTQMALLSPLLETDEVAAYLEEPQTLQYTVPGERVGAGWNL